MHDDVAASLQDVERLVAIMDDQRHQLDTAVFSATDEAQTVLATVDGHQQLVGVDIRDGLLRLGPAVVQERINEAVQKATTAASEALVEMAERLDDLITPAAPD